MRERWAGLIQGALMGFVVSALVLAVACKEPVIASTGAATRAPAPGQDGDGRGPGMPHEGDATQRDDSAGLQGTKGEPGQNDKDLLTVTGLLKSGYVGIGGEHTGWMLLSSGKSSDAIEVDVSKVMGQAKQNDGRSVTVTGKMIEKPYVERGKVKILVAESITAPPK